MIGLLFDMFTTAMFIFFLVNSYMSASLEQHIPFLFDSLVYLDWNFMEVGWHPYKTGWRWWMQAGSVPCDQTIQKIQSIQKSTRNSPLETRKQVSQWMAEDTVLNFLFSFRKFFRVGFQTSYWGSMWPRSDLFLGRTKNISVNIFLKVYVRDVCGTWHGLSTVTSIHSILKGTRSS